MLALFIERSPSVDSSSDCRKCTRQATPGDHGGKKGTAVVRSFVLFKTCRWELPRTRLKRESIKSIYHNVS